MAGGGNNLMKENRIKWRRAGAEDLCVGLVLMMCRWSLSEELMQRSLRVVLVMKRVVAREDSECTDRQLDASISKDTLSFFLRLIARECDAL